MVCIKRLLQLLGGDSVLVFVDCILDGKFRTKNSNMVASVTILQTIDHGRRLQTLCICSVFQLCAYTGHVLICMKSFQ